MRFNQAMCSEVQLLLQQMNSLQAVVEKQGQVLELVVGKLFPDAGETQAIQGLETEMAHGQVVGKLFPDAGETQAIQGLEPEMTHGHVKKACLDRHAISFS